MEPPVRALVGTRKSVRIGVRSEELKTQCLPGTVTKRPLTPWSCPLLDVQSYLSRANVFKVRSDSFNFKLV